jgi:hypothetical protein
MINLIISISISSYALDVDKLFDEPEKLIKGLFYNLVDKVLIWSGFTMIIGSIIHWLWSSMNGEHVKIGRYIGLILGALFFISFGIWLKTNGVSLFK